VDAGYFAHKYARGGHGGGDGTRRRSSRSEEERGGHGGEVSEEELEWRCNGAAKQSGTLFMSRHGGGFRSTVLALRSLARARDEHLGRQLLLFFSLSQQTKRGVL